MNEDYKRKLAETEEVIVDDAFPPDLLTWMDDFFAKVHPKLTPGMAIYPELYASGFFPLQRMGEAAAMIELARPIPPRVVMEIGADKGGGVYQWCQSLPSVEMVIACEIRGTPYASRFEAAFPGKRLIWLPKSSLKIRARDDVARRLGDRQIDVLFIDGDKSFFELDFDLWAPLMQPRGVAFFHDVTDPEPGRAFWSVVKRGYRHDVIIDRLDADRACAREAEGLPPASSHEGWLRHWKGRSCGVGVIWLDGKLR